MYKLNECVIRNHSTTCQILYIPKQPNNNKLLSVYKFAYCVCMFFFKQQQQQQNHAGISQCAQNALNRMSGVCLGGGQANEKTNWNFMGIQL